LQKPTRKIKVFIDTNVLIAGINSVTGASATLLDLCEAGVVQMVVSRQVLIEADRNFAAKFPQLVGRFRQFMHNLAPLMVDDPTPVNGKVKVYQFRELKSVPPIPLAVVI